MKVKYLLKTAKWVSISLGKSIHFEPNEVKDIDERTARFLLSIRKAFKEVKEDDRKTKGQASDKRKSKAKKGNRRNNTDTGPATPRKSEKEDKGE